MSLLFGLKIHDFIWSYRTNASLIRCGIKKKEARLIFMSNAGAFVENYLLIQGSNAPQFNSCTNNWCNGARFIYSKIRVESKQNIKFGVRRFFRQQIFRHRIFRNRFSDTKFSETNFLTATFFDGQILRQTNFPKSLYVFQTLIHVTHYTKILHKLNMQICICSYG